MRSKDHGYFYVVQMPRHGVHVQQGRRGRRSTELLELPHGNGRRHESRVCVRLRRCTATEHIVVSHATPLTLCWVRQWGKGVPLH